MLGIQRRAIRVLRDPLWLRRLAVTAVATAALVLLAARAIQGEVSESELTATSIAIAIVFGLINALQNELGERRRMTVELLGAISTADSLAAADAEVAQRLIRGKPIGADVDPEFDRSLIQVLDYYEFLCRSARSGAIDRKMLRALRGGTAGLLFHTAREYVAERRVLHGPELYAMTEWFVDDYCGMAKGLTAARGTTEPAHTSAEADHDLARAADGTAAP